MLAITSFFCNLFHILFTQRADDDISVETIDNNNDDIVVTGTYNEIVKSCEVTLIQGLQTQMLRELSFANSMLFPSPYLKLAQENQLLKQPLLGAGSGRKNDINRSNENVSSSTNLLTSDQANNSASSTNEREGVIDKEEVIKKIREEMNIVLDAERKTLQREFEIELDDIKRKHTESTCLQKVSYDELLKEKAEAVKKSSEYSKKLEGIIETMKLSKTETPNKLEKENIISVLEAESKEAVDIKIPDLNLRIQHLTAQLHKQNVELESIQRAEKELRLEKEELLSSLVQSKKSEETIYKLMDEEIQSMQKEFEDNHALLSRHQEECVGSYGKQVVDLIGKHFQMDAEKAVRDQDISSPLTVFDLCKRMIEERDVEVKELRRELHNTKHDNQEQISIIQLNSEHEHKKIVEEIVNLKASIQEKDNAMSEMERSLKVELESVNQASNEAIKLHAETIVTEYEQKSVKEREKFEYELNLEKSNYERARNLLEEEFDTVIGDLKVAFAEKESAYLKLTKEFESRQNEENEGWMQQATKLHKEYEAKLAAQKEMYAAETKNLLNQKVVDQSCIASKDAMLQQLQQERSEIEITLTSQNGLLLKEKEEIMQSLKEQSHEHEAKLQELHREYTLQEENNKATICAEFESKIDVVIQNYDKKEQHLLDQINMERSRADEHKVEVGELIQQIEEITSSMNEQLESMRNANEAALGEQEEKFRSEFEMKLKAMDAVRVSNEIQQTELMNRIDTIRNEYEIKIESINHSHSTREQEINEKLESVKLKLYENESLVTSLRQEMIDLQFTAKNDLEQRLLQQEELLRSDYESKVSDLVQNSSVKEQQLLEQINHERSNSEQHKVQVDELTQEIEKNTTSMNEKLESVRNAKEVALRKQEENLRSEFELKLKSMEDIQACNEAQQAELMNQIDTIRNEYETKIESINHSHSTREQEICEQLQNVKTNLDENESIVMGLRQEMIDLQCTAKNDLEQGLLQQEELLRSDYDSKVSDLVENSSVKEQQLFDQINQERSYSEERKVQVEKLTQEIEKITKSMNEQLESMRNVKEAALGEQEEKLRSEFEMKLKSMVDLQASNEVQQTELMNQIDTIRNEYETKIESINHSHSTREQEISEQLQKVKSSLYENKSIVTGLRQEMIDLQCTTKNDLEKRLLQQEELLRSDYDSKVADLVQNSSVKEQQLLDQINIERSCSEEHKVQVEELTQEIEKITTSMNEQLESMRNVKEAALSEQEEKLRSEFEMKLKAMDDIQASNEVQQTELMNQIDTIRNKYETQIESITYSYSTREQEISDELQKVKSSLYENKSIVTGLRQEMIDLQCTAKNDLEQGLLQQEEFLRSDYESKVADLVQNSSVKEQQLFDQINQERSYSEERKVQVEKLTQEIEKITTSMSEQQESMRNAKEAALSEQEEKLRSEFEMKFKTMVDLQASNEVQQTELMNQIEKNREEYDAKIELLKVSELTQEMMSEQLESLRKANAEALIQCEETLRSEYEMKLERLEQNSKSQEDNLRSQLVGEQSRLYEQEVLLEAYKKSGEVSKSKQVELNNQLKVVKEEYENILEAREESHLAERQEISDQLQKVYVSLQEKNDLLYKFNQSLDETKERIRLDLESAYQAKEEELNEREELLRTEYEAKCEITEQNMAIRERNSQQVDEATHLKVREDFSEVIFKQQLVIDEKETLIAKLSEKIDGMRVRMRELNESSRQTNEELLLNRDSEIHREIERKFQIPLKVNEELIRGKAIELKREHMNDVKKDFFYSNENGIAEFGFMQPSIIGNLDEFSQEDSKTYDSSRNDSTLLEENIHLNEGVAFHDDKSELSHSIDAHIDFDCLQRDGLFANTFSTESEHGDPDDSEEIMFNTLDYIAPAETITLCEDTNSNMTGNISNTSKEHTEPFNDDTIDTPSTRKASSGRKLLPIKFMVLRYLSLPSGSSERVAVFQSLAKICCFSKNDFEKIEGKNNSRGAWWPSSSVNPSVLPDDTTSHEKVDTDILVVKDLLVKYLSLPTTSNERKLVLPVLGSILGFVDNDYKKIEAAEKMGSSWW